VSSAMQSVSEMCRNEVDESAPPEILELDGSGAPNNADRPDLPAQPPN
jgi:hypothetical protein